MRKKYVVRLTDAERAVLLEVVRKLKGTSQKVRRAQILLKADAQGPGWTDRQIAEAFNCRTKTVENVRQHLVERGFEQTLNGIKPSKPPNPQTAGRRAGGQDHCHPPGTATAGVCQLDAAAVGRQGGGIEDRGISEL